MITELELDKFYNDLILPLDINDVDVINTYIPIQNREQIMKDYIIPINGIELRRVLRFPISKAIDAHVDETLKEIIHHKIQSIDMNWEDGFVPFVVLRGIIHNSIKNWIEEKAKNNF